GGGEFLIVLRTCTRAFPPWRLSQFRSDGRNRIRLTFAISLPTLRGFLPDGRCVRLSIPRPNMRRRDWPCGRNLDLALDRWRPPLLLADKNREFGPQNVSARCFSFSMRIRTAIVCYSDLRRMSRL